jgi:dTDP-glucose 4,6-dehydratase
VPFDDGLRRTVEWYRQHPEWWRPIKETSPAFREHYDRHYKG